MAYDPRINMPEDTLLENGWGVTYELIPPASYSIHWGNNQARRTLGPFEIGAPAHNLWYRDHNNSCIVLRAGCGNPCWYIYVLPLDSLRPVSQIWYPVSYDMENNLVATVEYNGDTLMKVRNFLTGADTSIHGSVCGEKGVFFGYCIDSVSIVDRQFYLRYFTAYEFDKPEKDRQVKEIRLHIGF